MVNMAMHMMDIAQNSIRSGANNILIEFNEISKEEMLIFIIKDDGEGIAEEEISKLVDPFYTTRTTRRVGLGIPFLKMTCEQTGGFLEISSKINRGTLIKAHYMTNNPDCLPLGDIAGYLTMLLVANPAIRFIFTYRIDSMQFTLDTDELTQSGINLQEQGMSSFFKSYINDNLSDVYSNRFNNSYIC